jgi:ankyrin repeat protein
MKTALVIYKKCMDPRLANVKDQDGNTPLHLLFSNFGPLREHDYSLKLAEVLYESSEDVNCYNKYMQTPVHVAVVFGNVKAIKFSLNRKKFDFNALGGER